MIETKEAQNRRVQVMDIDAVRGHLATDFVGFTVVHAALDAAASHPATESLGVVVTTGVRVHATRGRRGTAKFSAPDDEGLIEQATLLEVSDERRGGGIDGGTRAGCRGENVRVVIPTAGIDLDEADAALDEATSAEELGTEVALTVHIAGLLGLLRDVERVGRGSLHAEGEFEGFNAGLELLVFLDGLHVAAIELGHEVELLALGFFGRELALEVSDHLVGRSARTEGGLRTLEDTGQEGRLAAISTTPEADEAGEILAFGTESVQDPGTKAGLGENRRTGMHQFGGWTVGRDVGVHRTDDAHFVRLLLELRENFRNLEAGLTALLELEGRREEHATAAALRLLSVGLHAWLVVKGVEVRRGATSEDVNHVLGLGRQRSLTGLERCSDLGVRWINHVIGDHGAEGDGAHAHTGLAKEVAAGGGRREAVIAVLDFHRGGIYMFSVKGGWS